MTDRCMICPSFPTSTYVKTTIRPSVVFGAYLACHLCACGRPSGEDFAVTGPDGTVVRGVGQRCGVGACQGGATILTAIGDGITCSTFIKAAPEQCNGIDDDCNGKADDGEHLCADKSSCTGGQCVAPVDPINVFIHNCAISCIKDRVAGGYPEEYAENQCIKWIGTPIDDAIGRHIYCINNTPHGRETCDRFVGNLAYAAKTKSSMFCRNVSVPYDNEWQRFIRSK